MTLNLFLISLMWVFVLDLSGFIQEIEGTLSRMLFRGRLSVRIPKPFSCSLCMTFWTGIVYVSVAGPSLGHYALACLFSWLTVIEGSMLSLARDIIEAAIGKIGSLL